MEERQARKERRRSDDIGKRGNHEELDVRKAMGSDQDIKRMKRINGGTHMGYN